MSVRTEYKPGEFCWIDLMAHDMNAAAKFYGAVFGWTAVPQDTQGRPPYTIFQLQGQGVAGMGQMGDEMKSQGTPPIWNNYVSVSDAQATADKVAELGGNIVMPPMQVMDAGSMAVLSDPTGAMFSVWQPGNHFGAQRVNEVGCWCWNELATRDLPSAKDFYAKLFGWTYELNEDSPNEYYIIKHGDRMAGGMLPMDENWGDAPPNWGIYVTVDDIDKACGDIRSAGGAIMVEPFDAPPAGKIAVATDDNGGVFNVIQMSAEPE